MDGFIQLAPDDLQSIDGVTKLNNMLQLLFTNAPGDGNAVQDLSGNGSPNGVVSASIGSTYRQLDGAAGSSYYIKSAGTANTGWVAIPSLPLSQANGGTGSATGFPYIKCSNTQTQNTAGGSTTSGSWLTLILNTKDSDTASIATLTSNVISIPAGTYEVTAYVPLYAGGSSVLVQTRLFNSSDTAVLINGTSQAQGAIDTTATSFIQGEFTISGTKNVIIQYQTSHSQATTGQGNPVNFGAEVYSQIKLLKVA